MSGKSTGQSKEKYQAKSQSSVNGSSTSKSNVKTSESKEPSDKLVIDQALLKKIFEKTGDNPNDWTKCNAIRVEYISDRGKEKDMADSKTCQSKSGSEKQSSDSKDSKEKVRDPNKSSSSSSTEKDVTGKSSFTTSEAKAKTSKESTVASKTSTDASKDSKGKDHHNRKQKKSHQGNKSK